MNQQGTKLTDILNPPENRWLSELARRRELPAGVRIVKFGNEDDEADDSDRGRSGRKAGRRR
jgi:hypothetical protein